VAQFYTDDQQLTAGVRLDSEHPSVDLTAGGLGDEVLDLLVGGMLDAHSRFEAPEGGSWPELARSTVRAKRSEQIGIRTGKSGITAPATYTTAPRDVQPRQAEWQFDSGDRKLNGMAHGWQNGNARNHCPPRRLIGWSPGAKQAAQDLLKEADFRARG
jgi:hypothetical protein